MDLVKEIVHCILTGGFQMPLLVNLVTKSNQLVDLQDVGESVSSEYKSLEEEEDI